MDARSGQALLRRVDSSELIGLFALLSDISFFIKDRRGRFLALNQRGCEFCGVASEGEAIGKTDRDFFPPRRAEQYARDDQAVMKTGKAIVNRVESAPEAEGSPRLVITSKVPLRDFRGRVIGLAGFSRLTDQVREQPHAIGQLDKVMQHLHSSYEQPIVTSDLARMTGLSVSQFGRTFRRYFATSPRQYLLRVRIEAACRQLAQTGRTITAVAFGTGFHDHAHFTRVFQRIMRVTPSQYRRQHQQPGSAA